MPVLIWSGVAALVGWIVGSAVNNATEQPSVIIQPIGGGTDSGVSTPIKIGLYIAAGVAAIYLGKKLISKI